MDESVQRVVVDGRFDALFRDSSISIKQLVIELTQLHEWPIRQTNGHEDGGIIVPCLLTSSTQKKRAKST